MVRGELPWFIVGCAVVASLVFVVLRRSDETARCPAGLTAIGARCCGQGQTLDRGHCVGSATHCATDMTLIEYQGQHHCQHPLRRVPIADGTLSLNPTDWEAEGLIAERTTPVRAFDLDDSEVTWNRYLTCVAEGPCASFALPQPTPLEPGLPLTNVSPEQATQICVALGGRLPTGDEWLLAAVGPVARKFPWGTTGLVCRRAAFGLAQGPCAMAGEMPELAGSRPDGASELGILDLAGNVAEWTRESSGFIARGGSFRSTLAGQLKSWASIEAAGPSSDIGFRCAYDPR